MRGELRWGDQGRRRSRAGEGRERIGSVPGGERARMASADESDYWHWTGRDEEEKPDRSRGWQLSMSGTGRGAKGMTRKRARERTRRDKDEARERRAERGEDEVTGERWKERGT